MYLKTAVKIDNCYYVTIKDSIFNNISGTLGSAVFFDRNQGKTDNSTL